MNSAHLTLSSLTPPEPGQRVRLHDHLEWMRLALPYAGLRHVNVWLLRDEDGLTLIDTGVCDEATRRIWQSFLEHLPAGQKLRRILVTHFHPDHSGCAGWLAAQTGAEVMMSAQESARLRWFCLDTQHSYRDAAEAFFRACGLDKARVARQMARGNVFPQRVSLPPAQITRIQAGDMLRLGGQSWHVRTSGGHAPEHVSLFSPQSRILIAGDQVLPHITPNISVLSIAPAQDALADYLASLPPFRIYPEDTWVLPSHGLPYHGLWARLDALEAHHAERLEKVLDFCRTPRTAAQVMDMLFRPDLDDHQAFFAIGEAVAHLNYLWHRGRVSRTEQENVWAWKTAAR